MPVVQIPGVGDVTFPDNMSDKDISAVIRSQILPTIKPVQAKPEPGIASEIGSILKSGTGQGIASLGKLGQYAGIGGKDLEEYGAGMTKRATEALSPGTQAALQRQFLQEAPEGQGFLGYQLGDAKLTDIPAQFLQSVPVMAGTMAAAVGAITLAPASAVAGVGTGVLGFLGRVGLGKVAGRIVSAAGAEAGAAEALAGKLAINTLAGNVAEGLAAAGSSGIETEKAIHDFAKLNPDGFFRSPIGQQALQDADGDKKKAIELGAFRAGRSAAALTGISTAILATPGSAFESVAVFGKGAKSSRLRSAILGGIAEGPLQELPQGSAEQYIQNLQRIQAGEEISPGKGVLEAGVQGAIIGAPIGGALGAITGSGKPQEPISLDARFQELATKYAESLNATTAYSTAARDIEKYAQPGETLTVYDSLGREIEVTIAGKNDAGRAIVNVNGEEFALGNEYTVSDPKDGRYGVKKGDEFVASSELNKDEVTSASEDIRTIIEKLNTEFEQTKVKIPEHYAAERRGTALDAANAALEVAEKKAQEEAAEQKAPAVKPVRPAAPAAAQTSAAPDAAPAPPAAPASPAAPAAPAAAAPAEQATAQTMSAEQQAAIDFIAAVDLGGIPLNPSKANAIARGLGLEVNTKSKPEETIQRIRDAVGRITPTEQTADLQAAIDAASAAGQRATTEQEDSVEFDEDAINEEVPTASLPANLSGASPRYNSNLKSVTPTFESDVDKAAYIVSGKGKSKQHQAYVDWLSQNAGFTEQQSIDHGKKVRESIKSSFNSAKDGKLNIPSVEFSSQSGASAKESRAPRTKKGTPAVQNTLRQLLTEMRKARNKEYYDKALPRVAALVKKRLGQLGLGKHITEDFTKLLQAGREESGQYLKRVINLAIAGRSDKQIMSVLDHEAIHAMRAIGMITENEWKNLKNLAEKRGWIKTFLINDRYEGKLNPTTAELKNSGLSLEEWIQEAKYEEAIADAFSTYANGRSTILGYDENDQPVYRYKKDLKLAGQPVGIISRILKILGIVKDVVSEDVEFKRFIEAPREADADKLKAETVSPKLSVANIKDGNILSRIAEIEGETFVRQQEQGGGYTVKAIQDELSDLEDAGYGPEDLSNRVIYGKGGYNRYQVGEDGAVRPIKSSFDDREDQYEKAVSVLGKRPEETSPKLSVSKADLGREKTGQLYEVYNRKTGKVVGGPYQSRSTARSGADRNDDKYGGYAHDVREVEQKASPKFSVAAKLTAKEKTEPVWYSALSRQIDKLPQKEMTAAQWKALLVKPEEVRLSGVRDAKNKVMLDSEGKPVTTSKTIPAESLLPNVKMAEIKATEILEWIDAQEGKVSKEQIQQFLEQGGAKIEFQDEVLGAQTKEPAREGAEEDLNEVLFKIDDLVNRREEGSISEKEYKQKYSELSEIRNELQLEIEVEENQAETQFSDYQLPGGKNYREAFVTVPNATGKGKGKNFAVFNDRDDAYYVGDRNTGNPISRFFATQIEAENSLEGFNRAANASNKWVDGHGAYSGIDNPVVRIRFNDRTDVDGNKVLFLEELQPPNNPEFGKMPKTLQDRWLAIGLKRMIRYAAENGYDKVAWTTGEQQVQRYESALRKQVDSIEWEKTPEGVQIVGYKGKISSTDARTDAQFKERINDFTKQIDELRNRMQDWRNVTGLEREQIRSLQKERSLVRDEWASFSSQRPTKVADTRYAENNLTEAIGKVMADRIRNDPSQTGVIEGDNLTVDSVGVKKLYDVGVPALANKILKEMGGGKVGETKIQQYPPSSRTQEDNEGYYPIQGFDGSWYLVDPDGARLDNRFFKTKELALAELNSKGKTETQPSFDITPALSKRAMQGMPRFSVAPKISRNIVQNNEGYWIYKGELPESFYRWFGKSVVTDKDGYPRVMFHGTARDITEFKQKQANAIFITDDEAFAGDFSAMSFDWMRSHIDQFVTPELQKELAAKAKKIRAADKSKIEYEEFQRLLLDELPSGKNIMPLFVMAEKPFDYSDTTHLAAVRKELEKNSDFSKQEIDLVLDTVKRGVWWEIERDEVQAAIRAAGFDGFYAKEAGRVNLAVYDANQVKSVTGNSGEYSRESKDIRRSVAPRLSSNEREQSTAKPSAKPNKNPEKQKFLPGEISLRDPIGQFLVITGSDIRDVPEHLANVVRSISQYNAFPTSNDPDTMLRNMHETIVGNLVWLYDLIPENIRARAKLWYDGANRIAIQMSDKYGYTPEQTAGVYAVLSPQKDWFMNVSLGDRVIAVFKERQNEMVSLPMKAWVDSYVKGSKTKADRIKRQEYAAKVRMLGSKRLKDMNNKEAALFIRTFDETYNPRQYRIITPEGGFLGFVTNNERDESDVESDIVEEGHVAWGSLSTIQKSVSILRNGSKSNISDQLGAMHKVRNFYNNILVPGSRAGHVTIDTHAVAAAFFKALSAASEEVSNNFGTAVSKNLVPEGRERFGPGGSNITGASGTYGFIADAYRDAASRVAKRDNIDLLPREMQSITWEAIRAIFPAAWKRENAFRVEDIYNRAKFGEITLEAARDEVKALASTKSGGKLINEFAWEQATEGKAVKDGGTSFDQDIDPIVAKRKARLIEPYIIRDKFKVNLSAATTSEQLPGVAALYADAKAGSVAARRLLQEYAQDNLNHLLSGIEGIKVSFNGAIGLYNKDTEPALSMTVSFPEKQRDRALAALNKFSTNFNQERFDVREKTNKDVGHVFDDGSYATAAVYFKIKSALNDDQVQELIDGSGLAGLTFGKDFVEAYYVAENLEKAADSNEYEKFYESIGTLEALLGQNTGKVETQVQRIWPYGSIGTGYGVTAERRNLGSYVPESSQVNNKTIKRVADYLNNKYRLTLTEEQQKSVPKTLKSFSPEKELTPKQDALQSMIARFMDLLPNNNLKNKLVVQGYKNLSQALLEQYKAMPIKVEINAEIQDGKLVVLPDRYENLSSKMRKDIQDNNHLYIYPTTKDTFGPEGEDFSKHPLFAQSGLKDINGYPLRYNDLLRAVHDYYAHGMSGGAFGPLGEEAAWKTHIAMTPDPLARWALTMETRAQNSWINFRENIDRSTPFRDRQFSPQKAAFLPIEFALTGTPAIDALMKQYIATLTPVERLGSPVKDKITFNRLLQEHRKNKTDDKYPKYSIAAQQITSGKYSHAMQYPDMPKANWPLVPETAFYRNNPDRDDIAIYKGKFIQLPWGDDKKSFGMDHILHNAIRQSNRRWEQVTDKDDENAILGIIDILNAKDLKVFKESPLDNKIIIRSGKFKRAIILGENKDDLRIISVVPSEIPKFGKIIDQTPDVKMSDEVLFQYKNNFTGIKVKFRFETPPATVTVKKTRSYELPKQSVAPRITRIPGDTAYDIPNEPGSTPIKEGYIRLYHQTEGDNLRKIEKEGLLLKHAKGIEGPRAIYAGESPFYGKSDSRPTLEFQVPKKYWDSPFVLRDVTPEDIIAAHYPWHRHARYLEDEEGIINVLSGRFDYLDKDDGKSPNETKALRYIKAKYELSSKQSIAPKFSTARTVGATKRPYTPEQLKYFSETGRTIEIPTLRERIQALFENFSSNLAQGIADQFDPLKKLDPMAYLLARMSRGTSGALESLLKYGKLKIRGGLLYDADRSGGFLEKVVMPMKGEFEDFLWWVAANRAGTLFGVGKENLFSPANIIAGKALQNGTLTFSYKLSNGTTTTNRSEMFKDSLVKYNAFNSNVLDMAEQSGLVDTNARSAWEQAMYVPFFRVSEDQKGFIGEGIKQGLVRQAAFKTLKGGTNKLNSDLMSNVLQNWYHLIDASAKNRASNRALDVAVATGAAVAASESTIRSMGKSLDMRSGVVWDMRKGRKQYYLVEDQAVVEALTALEPANIPGPMMKGLHAFKYYLTLGVTISPYYKVRNLIRDSVQSVAVSDLSYNVFKNLSEGYAATDRKSQDYVTMLASGATMRFGTSMEGDESGRVRALVKSGVKDSTILDSPGKVKAFFDQLRPFTEMYSDIGSRGEEINRAALYKRVLAKLTSQGMSSDDAHAQAAFLARDLMDFSMQGSWGTIRFLTQVVPFMNSRIQGLYKLGRAFKQDKARMAIVIGAASVLGLTLMAMFKDDDDWKKRTDADRNNYWWFKFGGIAYRIPKPFEVGAISTVAERGWELFFDNEMTGKRFSKNMEMLLLDNLAMNPIPQVFKPLLDVYSNKDGHSGIPIETMGMEKLLPEFRFTSETTAPAKALSTLAMGTLSPVQIDHMIKGYFGWLGTFVVGGADMAVNLVTSGPAKPSIDIISKISNGMVRTLPEKQSRYVNQIYEQAKELEQVYGTQQYLLQKRKLEEYREFTEENKEKLRQYRLIEPIKKMESALNKRIRQIEDSTTKDSDTKRDEINALQQRRDQLARRLSARFQ